MKGGSSDYYEDTEGVMCDKREQEEVLINYKQEIVLDLIQKKTGDCLMSRRALNLFFGIITSML